MQPHLSKCPGGCNASFLLITTFIILLSSSCFERNASVKLKKPDDNRFTPVVLTQEGDLDEPLNFEVLKDGRVYINERKGALKLYDPVSKTVKVVANIPVNTKYTSKDGVVTEAEEGFIGFTIDPDFESNHWAYLFYAHPMEKKDVLSRWELRNDKLIKGSEKILLEIPTQREVCCHTGGGMTWDAKGNLYITVGNNTANVASKSSTDEREGRSSWDDQRSSASTNDLRGKILRIHPEKDGTYSIPEGNLFPKGTPKTRPEIYTMGNRNPWRPSIDSKTGWLYWGEVGPDANKDTKTARMGMDELNQARKSGFFGWPYFIGENAAYPIYDYKNESIHDGKDANHPTNSSVNNTGIKDLPPAQPAFISYPYGVSKKFPLVGTGSRAAVGGPVYHKNDRKNAKRPFPEYYEGKWFATDIARGWIMAITMNEKGDYESMERFLPSYHPIEPIDMKFGPDGDLYVLEYGNNWFRKSDNAKLTRIEYNAGNRIPVVEASANVLGGSVPLKVNLSSKGTRDYDGDKLNYQWKIKAVSGGAEQIFTQSNPSLTLSQPGVYTAILTVTDAFGAKNSKSVNITAGNEPPAISVNITGNETFFLPNQPFNYNISVSDKEDGMIDPKQVAVSIDYISEGFDLAEVNQQQRSVDASAHFAVAKAIIMQSDCKNCHNINSKSIGPMFTSIADKYQSRYSWALDSLPKKVRGGGSGVWGDVTMPAHPAISLNDARTIVKYILSIRDKNINTLPLNGSYMPQIPRGDNGNGSLIIRASYTDKGALSAPSLTTEKIITLHAPQLNAASADVIKNADKKMEAVFVTSLNVIPKKNGYIGFKNIDLTNIKQLEINASANKREGFKGGMIEIHLDKSNGQLIGQAEIKTFDLWALMNDTGVQANSSNQNDFLSLISRPPTKVDIKNATGKHDLYFVFKNDAAKSADPLMSVSTIKFNDKSVSDEYKTLGKIF